jgi:N-acetylglutamate synthase-like GNAT family acetyltransferase
MSMTWRVMTQKADQQAELARVALELLGELPYLGFAQGEWIVALNDDGNARGVVCLKVEGTTGCLRHLALADLTLGRLLLQRAANVARYSGCTELFASVATGAIKTTEFVAAGFHQHVKTDAEGGALVWKKDLL